MEILTVKNYVYHYVLINNIIKYDKPVLGNKIQELQFKKIFYLIKQMI